MTRPPASAPRAHAVRRAASQFPTGVALLTAPGGLALVIDSFLSLSLDPPLVGFSPSITSLTWRRMRRAGRFGISVLGVRHGHGLRDRARPGADRLAGLDIDVMADGTPVVADALAILLCTLEAEHPAGDHTLAIGRVEELRHGDPQPPLVFFGGRFLTVSTGSPAGEGAAPR